MFDFGIADCFYLRTPDIWVVIFHGGYVGYNDWTGITISSQRLRKE